MLKELVVGLRLLSLSISFSVVWHFCELSFLLNVVDHLFLCLVCKIVMYCRSPYPHTVK